MTLSTCRWGKNWTQHNGTITKLKKELGNINLYPNLLIDFVTDQPERDVNSTQTLSILTICLSVYDSATSKPKDRFLLNSKEKYLV